MFYFIQPNSKILKLVGSDSLDVSIRYPNYLYNPVVHCTVGNGLVTKAFSAISIFPPVFWVY